MTSTAFRSLALAIAGAALSSPLPAQAIPTWTRTLDLSQVGDGDSPWTLLHDPATQRVFVAGWYTVSTTPLEYAGFVAAYDASGTPLWNRTIAPPAGRHRFAYRLGLHPSGGVVAVGQETPASFGDADVLVTRIDANGTIAWSTTWDGPAQSIDDAFDVLVEPNGSVRVGVGTWSNSAPGLVAGLLLLDANGLNPVLLPIPASGAEPIAGTRLGRASNGDLFHLGLHRLTRLAPNGTEIWSTPFPGGHSAARLAVGPGDACSIPSAVVLAPNQSPSFAVIRIAGDGMISWTRTISAPATPVGMANAIGVDANGMTIAAGFWSSAIDQIPQANAALVVAFFPDGTEAWRRDGTFSGLVPESFDQLGVAPNGDAILQGTSRDSLGRRHGVLARVARDGSDAWALESAPFTFFPSGAIPVGVAASADEAAYSATVRAGAASGDTDTVVERHDTSALATCSGDGSASPCPCANTATQPTIGGCLNSLGLSSRLAASGSTSLANDTWILTATDLPATTTALFFQGTLPVAGGTPFGDGLRCVGGTVVRLGTKTSASGTVSYPALGDASASVAGAIAGPGPRWYQVWYRNAAAFCSASTFNLTNGVRGLWIP